MLTGTVWKLFFQTSYTSCMSCHAPVIKVKQIRYIERYHYLFVPTQNRKLKSFEKLFNSNFKNEHYIFKAEWIESKRKCHVYRPYMSHVLDKNQRTYTAWLGCSQWYFEKVNLLQMHWLRQNHELFQSANRWHISILFGNICLVFLRNKLAVFYSDKSFS